MIKNSTRAPFTKPGKLGWLTGRKSHRGASLVLLSDRGPYGKDGG